MDLPPTRSQSPLPLTRADEPLSCAVPFGFLHAPLVAIAKLGTVAFFSRIHIDGEEEVPREGDGPMLALANHWNSAVDPAMLSCFFPHSRKLHYWAKSTLFVPGLADKILTNAGNIPIDRRNKDNQKAFAKTFDCLKFGEGVAIFPEGGSWTMPRLGELKHGASWVALEYASNLRQTHRTLSTGLELPPDYPEPKDVLIVVAGITYTDKQKYRSSAVMQFGKSVQVGPYVDEFLQGGEAAKSAVKKLTAEVERAMLRVTVNAKDWDSLHAAVMARKMLWVDEATIPLASLRDIGQTLVDLFAQADSDPRLLSLRDLLLAYRSSLLQTHLSHFALSGVSLPDSLDPNVPFPMPGRLRVLGHLLKSTLASSVRLPFFALPLLVHLPIYIVGAYSIRLSELEEDHAQFKIALGLMLAFGTYVSLFSLACVFLSLVPLGFILAALGLVAFWMYHQRLIDDNYNAGKRLVASWRVLVGIWAPVAKSSAAAALRRHSISLAYTPLQSHNSPHQSPNANGSPNMVRTGSRNHTRGLSAGYDYEEENEVRQVLRLRVQASQALAEYLEQRVRDDFEGEELVRKLVDWGAEVGRGSGRLGTLAEATRS